MIPSFFTHLFGIRSRHANSFSREFVSRTTDVRTSHISSVLARQVSMDPVSAIGVAAAVVQFVDYGMRILSRARQIYRSIPGGLDTELEREQLEDLRDLRRVAVQAEDSSGVYDAALRENIKSAARDFDVVLASMKAKRRDVGDGHYLKRAWHSTNNAVLSLRDESAVKEMDEKLKKIHTLVVRSTLSALW